MSFMELMDLDGEKKIDINQWILLIIMATLNKINYWFKDKIERRNLDIRCADLISAKFPRTSSVIKKSKFIL